MSDPIHTVASDDEGRSGLLPDEARFLVLVDKPKQQFIMKIQYRMTY